MMRTGRGRGREDGNGSVVLRVIRIALNYFRQVPKYIYSIFHWNGIELSFPYPSHWVNSGFLKLLRLFSVSFWRGPYLPPPPLVRSSLLSRFFSLSFFFSTFYFIFFGTRLFCILHTQNYTVNCKRKGFRFLSPAAAQEPKTSSRKAERRGIGECRTVAGERNYVYIFWYCFIALDLRSIAYTLFKHGFFGSNERWFLSPEENRSQVGFCVSRYPNGKFSF